MPRKADITVQDLATGGGLKNPEQGGAMPIMRCRLSNGEMGYKWGKHGTCYPSRAGAERQARAAYASGYTGKEEGAVEALEKEAAEDQKVAALGGMGKRRRRRYRY